MSPIKPLVFGAVLSLLLSLSALAQKPPTITGLTPVDVEFMAQQRERVDSLARSRLGRQLNGRRADDLSTLQSLLDRGLVRADQTLELQAMGLVLGDLLAEDLGLHWVVYEDSYGRSRALRLEQSSNVLFPVTMISRRIEAGAEVSINAVYSKARNEMLPHITPLPFSD